MGDGTDAVGGLIGLGIGLIVLDEVTHRARERRREEREEESRPRPKAKKHKHYVEQDNGWGGVF